MRRSAESLLGHLLVLSRLHRVLLQERGIIVTFHRVNDILPEDGLTRRSRIFEEFCRFFRANFDVVPMTELVSRLDRKASLAGTLAITFDDGYLDNYELAAPILRKLGLPATFFVVTGFIGTKTVPWWDAGLAQHPGWMSWDMVRELSREGFDVGAHTRTHPDLGTIDGAEADAEIAGSKQDLVEVLGRAPDHFAFPYGQRKNLLESNRQRIVEAGYRSCVSCHGGVAPSDADPFRLARIPISAWLRTPQQFVFEVVTGKV
jgi:peptidoglycan/xylan/chitin deacetylase (PgdA/CDA1 family)